MPAWRAVDDRPPLVVIDDVGPLPTEEQLQLLQKWRELLPHQAIVRGTAYTERDFIADAEARVNSQRTPNFRQI